MPTLTLFGKTFSQLKESLVGFGANVKTNGLFETLFKTSSIDTSVIGKYNTLISQNVNAQDALKQASVGANKATIQLMQSANGAAVSTEALTAAQKSSTIAAKTAAIGWTALQAAMNVVAIFAVIKGIQLLVKAIDNYIHRVDIAKDKLKEFNEEIDSKRNTYKEYAQLVDKAAESYDKLASKVNTDTNYNLGLDEDEYEEFISLNNELAEAFPTLVKGYDESGNAILIESTTENSLQTYKKSI